METIKEKINKSNTVIGLKQVVKHAHKAELEEIFLASDVDDFLKEKVSLIADEKDVPVTTVGTMHKLGKACKIDVSAAVVGILK